MIRINSVFFSPTQTSEKILNAVAESCGDPNPSSVNLTYGEESADFNKDDLILFAFPVFAGRIPELALQRMEKLKGQNRKAVVIVVYGNRHYDDALLELYNVVEKAGFNVLSAAAFIGEHSFSTSDFPIAPSRPDVDDLQKARDYGTKIRELLQSGTVRKDSLSIPGQFPYKERPLLDPVSPVTEQEFCRNCMACLQACPSGAVISAKPDKTDPEKCIKCCACIKVCPEKARRFADPGIAAITERLYKNFSERREPEIFI